MIVRNTECPLFQRFLQEESRREDYKISSNLRATAETLAEIIKYTTRERDESIRSILVHGHPIFNQLAEATRIRIRIQFFNRKELDTLLTTFGYTMVDACDTHVVYQRTYSGTETTLRIDPSIFDEAGKLWSVEPDEWKKQFVMVKKREIPDDDDIPF